MAWLGVQEVKKNANFSENFSVKEDNIKFALRWSLHEIEDWIEPDDYAFILATETEPTGVTQTDKDNRRKWNRLRDGHALLTLSKLPMTQTQFRNDGTVSSERDGADAGTISFQKPDDLRKTRSDFETEAKALIAPYMRQRSVASSMGTLQIGTC
jgi:hypothetical protein